MKSGDNMRIIKKTSLIILAAMLVFSSGSFAYSNGINMGEEVPFPDVISDIVEKNESVYARLTGNGEVEGIYVINHFELTGIGHFTDFGDYSSVTNLSNIQPLTLNSGEIAAMADSNSFFYQGYLRDSNLPWLYDISYYLNGDRITQTDLAGQTGNLEIRVTSSKNDAVNEIFYNNYMQQITVTLNIDKCRNIVSEGATVANAGKNRTMVYTIMPKSDANISITAEVEDIEMAGISITAVPFGMSFTMPDTSRFIGELDVLIDAIDELNRGTGLLYDGSVEIIDGYTRLLSGSSGFREGISLLSNGSAQITDASVQIRSVLMQIVLGLSSLQGSDSSSVMDELAQLSAGLLQLADGLRLVTTSMRQLNTGFAPAFAALSSAINNIPDHQLTEEQLQGLLATADAGSQMLIGALIESYSAAMIVKGTFAQTEAAFSAVIGALDSLSESTETIEATLRGIVAELNGSSSGEDPMGQISQLVEGLTTLSSNYDEFHNGILAYTQGLDELAIGYNEINSGFIGLGDGLLEMRNGISVMNDGTSIMSRESIGIPDMVQAEIDSLMDDYIGSDFEVVSFTSDRNRNIGFVQFIFLTDGVAKPVADNNARLETENLTFWDRLRMLFTP